MPPLLGSCGCPCAPRCSSTDDVIFDAALTSAGDLLIGGSFSMVNCVYRRRSSLLTPHLETHPLWWGGINQSDTTDWPANTLAQVFGVCEHPVDGSFWLTGRFDDIGGARALLSAHRGNIWRVDSIGDPDSGFHTTWLPGLPAVDGTIRVRRVKPIPVSTALAVVCDFPANNDPDDDPTTDDQFYIAVLNADGSVFAGFWPHAWIDTDGHNIGGGCHDVMVVSAGPDYADTTFYCVTAANFPADTFPHSPGHPGVIRLNHDGTLDVAFEPNYPGIGYDNTDPECLARTADGRILIGAIGGGGAPNTGIFLLDATGAPDPDFDPGDGIDNDDFFTVCQTLADAGGDKFYLAGNFQTYDGVTRENLCRINLDGTLDTTFPNVQIRTPGGTGGGPGSTRIFVNKVLVHPDTGDVYIFGDFTQVLGAPRQYMARLSSSGVLL